MLQSPKNRDLEIEAEAFASLATRVFFRGHRSVERRSLKLNDEVDMKNSVLTVSVAAVAALAFAGAASAGIYPGGGCGCIVPCFPYPY